MNDLEQIEEIKTLNVNDYWDRRIDKSERPSIVT